MRYIYIYIYISCITLRTLNYGSDSLVLVMGNAGCIPSTVHPTDVNAFSDTRIVKLSIPALSLMLPGASVK